MVMNGNPPPTNDVMITANVLYVIEKNEVLLLFVLKQVRCSIMGLMLLKTWGKQVQAISINVVAAKFSQHLVTDGDSTNQTMMNNRKC